MAVAIEIDLFEVSQLYGGGLYFAGDLCSDVVHAYADRVRTNPETMASSILLMQYPDPAGSYPARCGGMSVASTHPGWIRCGVAVRKTGRISADAVLSALADDERLRLFAGIVTTGPDDDGGPAPDRRATARLVAAGLVEQRDDGSHRLNRTAFRDALESLRPVTGRYPPGIRRFFDDRGRIAQIPSGSGPRRALLAFVVTEAFGPGLAYSEAQVDHALRRYHDDHSMLRRYAVDLGLLRRNADGSDYRLSSGSR